MYNTSHQGTLEYLAQNNTSYIAPQNKFYSAAAPASSSYDDGMFIPSRDLLSYSSEAAKPLSYSLNHGNYLFSVPQMEDHFIPDNFLKPGKEGIFVGQAEEVKEFVEDAFRHIFHKSFPNNVKISILDGQEFRKIAPQESTVGLSINRGREGLLSEIFILNDSLGRVMLTIGHELGHVLTKTLSRHHDEEAKAYAFSLVWIDAIKKNNIADLGGAIITERPAENGLHNVAFNFVHRLISQGKEAWETYVELVGGMVSVESDFSSVKTYKWEI